MENLNFSDTKKAFSHKTNYDLKKEQFLFKIVTFPILSSLGTKTASFLGDHNLLPRWLFKNSFFSHFCGGETLEEAKKKTQFLKNHNIERIFFYSVEGGSSKEETNKVKEETLNIFRKSQEKSTYCALKLTGLISPIILEKIQKKETLTKKEKEQYLNFQKNFDTLCSKAEETKTHLMIDAEESWFQDVIDQLCLEKMIKHNKKFPTIYTTLQMYRKDKLDDLKNLIKEAKEKNFYLGLKIVRGAYLIKENEMASKKRKECILYRTKKDTDKAYDKAIKICYENLDKVALFAGTHNMDSMTKFSHLYKENFEKSFYLMASQLKGMCDNITFNLANNNIPASKYIPFGPVEKAIPYLIRRAEENNAILGETARELSFIKKELERRKRLH